MIYTINTYNDITNPMVMAVNDMNELLYSFLLIIIYYNE